MKPYYSADGITLYQGDNREVLAALGLKPDDVALLWGDPPYGMNMAARSHGRRKGTPVKVIAPIIGDDRAFDPISWLSWPRIVLWGANYYFQRLPVAESWWAWDKKCQPWECDQADGELAWTNLGGPPRFYRQRWIAGTAHVHPTEKPVALAAWGFRQAKLKPGDLVLSPWLGSGPEAVAARDMGLRFIGIELVTEYLDSCVNRLRQAPLPLVTTPPEPEQVGLGLSLDSPPAKR